MYRAKFYQRGKRKDHYWTTSPELDIADEVKLGQQVQIKKHGKMWRVIDVYWCFVQGPGKSEFSHFEYGVI